MTSIKLLIDHIKKHVMFPMQIVSIYYSVLRAGSPRCSFFTFTSSRVVMQDDNSCWLPNTDTFIKTKSKRAYGCSVQQSFHTRNDCTYVYVSSKTCIGI